MRIFYCFFSIVNLIYFFAALSNLIIYSLKIIKMDIGEINIKQTLLTNR